MSYYDQIMDLLGEQVSPTALLEEAETTQQKARRLVDRVQDPEAAEPPAPASGLQDTQQAAMPDPSSDVRLKQKLRDMLTRRGL